MKLNIVKHWRDDDGMVQLELRASTPDYTTSLTFYTYPDRLMQFARALSDFSGAYSDQPCFEEGSQEDTCAYWIRLRALSINGRGHSLLQVSTVNRGDLSDAAACSFSSALEVAAINRLGTTLAHWVQTGTSDYAFDPAQS